jgi:hypothetical protein
LTRKSKVPKSVATLKQQVRYFHKIFKLALVLMQIGCYFKCFGDATQQLSTLMGYQLKPVWRGLNQACGFHQRFLPKVAATLNAKQLPYVIVRQTGKYLRATLERLPQVRVEFAK